MASSTPPDPDTAAYLESLPSPAQRKDETRLLRLSLRGIDSFPLPRSVITHAFRNDYLVLLGFKLVIHEDHTIGLDPSPYPYDITSVRHLRSECGPQPPPLLAKVMADAEPLQTVEYGDEGPAASATGSETSESAEADSQSSQPPIVGEVWEWRGSYAIPFVPRVSEGAGDSVLQSADATGGIAAELAPPPSWRPAPCAAPLRFSQISSRLIFEDLSSSPVSVTSTSLTVEDSDDCPPSPPVYSPSSTSSISSTSPYYQASMAPTREGTPSSDRTPSPEPAPAPSRDLGWDSTSPFRKLAPPEDNRPGSIAPHRLYVRPFWVPAVPIWADQMRTGYINLPFLVWPSRVEGEAKMMLDRELLEQMTDPWRKHGGRQTHPSDDAQIRIEIIGFYCGGFQIKKSSADKGRMFVPHYLTAVKGRYVTVEPWAGPIEDIPRVPRPHILGENPIISSIYSAPPTPPERRPKTYHAPGTKPDWFLAVEDLPVNCTRRDGQEYDDSNRPGLMMPWCQWPWDDEWAAERALVSWRSLPGGYREGAERIVGGGEEWQERFERLKKKKSKKSSPAEAQTS